MAPRVQPAVSREEIIAFRRRLTAAARTPHALAGSTTKLAPWLRRWLPAADVDTHSPGSN
jgi:hypothetical protein